MRKLNLLEILAVLLVIIGGLNWGLVGLFRFDLVAAILGSLSIWTRVIYVLVGLAALYLAISSGKLSMRTEDGHRDRR